MKRIVIIGLLLNFVAGCGSESFTEIEKDRAPLFPGYESYASREEVTAKLPRDIEKNVVEETSLAKDDSKPPYRIYTLRVAPYKHLDQSGALLITFYNDRLLQTAFYPEKLDEYVAALKKSGTGVRFGQEFVGGSYHRFGSALILITNTTSAGRTSVCANSSGAGWPDIRESRCDYWRWRSSD